MSRLALLLVLLLTLQAQAEPPLRDEVNALSLLVGTRVVDKTGAPLAVALGLFDGKPCTQYDPSLTQNEPLILELNEPFELTRLEAINSADEEFTPGISVKTLRIELGAHPWGPWEQQLDWTLQKGSQPQSRPLMLPGVRYLRVTLVANHGNPEWMGLSELRAWGRPSASRDAAFNGSWMTTYGEVRLTQAGPRITGCYGTAGSQISDKILEGTWRDGAFVGTWHELNGTSARNKGPVVFALTKEGDLSGVWGYAPSERTSRWDGKKLAKSTLTCPKPKRNPEP